MKILHLCLSNYYIDNYGYQENILPIMNKNSGHEVRIIASTEVFIDNRQLGYVSPSEYITREEIPIERLAYRKILPHFLMKKIRSYNSLYDRIESFQPDIILSHGVPMLDLLILKKYKQNYPKTKIFLDSHEDSNNSATNWVSKTFLHRLFYRRVIKSTLESFERILYITKETKDFLVSIYNIPETMLEYYPLGGTISKQEDIRNARERLCNKLNIDENEIIYFHSGKLNAAKRTKELLEAFIQVKANGKLIIAGEIEDIYEEEIRHLLIEDNIHYVGWLDQQSLRFYLNGCDVYLQPGSQSATLQQALCCNCAVAVYPYSSHFHLLNNIPYYITDEESLRSFFELINRADIERKKTDGYALAKKRLDYRVLASRITE